MIKEVSKEQQIIDNFHERGCSIMTVTVTVNICCFKSGLIPGITQSTVIGDEQQMESRDVPVEKRDQGSTDPNSKWAKANLCGIAQRLIRLGKADGLNLSQFMVNGKMMKEYDIKYLEEKLGSISEFGIANWDEAHHDCRTAELGGRLGTTTNRQFAHDKNGNYDPDATFAGEY